MNDKKEGQSQYFINAKKYNCPYCDTNKTPFSVTYAIPIDWTNSKKAYVYIVWCKDCYKSSIHISKESLMADRKDQYGRPIREDNFKKDLKDIDSKIIFSHPTSFFVLDSRIPKILRRLITEAEDCLNGNLLTGASACVRKSIYEMTIIEKAIGDDYESKIKSLKKKYPNIESGYFDSLAAIQSMTSDNLHEQSWESWDSPTLKTLIEMLKNILYEMYVLPAEKKDRSLSILKIKEKLSKDKKDKKKDDTTQPSESE
ncbi:MAG: hypothetical protein IIB94_02210 [Candidatus Marinimicrobia bacterium]|nr:hypothetical protein [Candidatus Neomarinimicrobiota bacterium]